MNNRATLYECGIDYGELLSRVEGDQVLLGELISLFVEAFPSNYKRLMEAIAANDASRTRECAHALKGMLGTLSYWRAHGAAYEIERIAASGTVLDLAEKAVALQEEVRTGQRALAALGAGGEV